MSFQALLFCQDEKTARTVTQVLTELDFQVDACSETFAAVKKLTSQAFEAVVVDCQNEENAGLLLKTARNSASNQASLMVAVVEGQAGVAAAFRIGANLVLTKPIAIEQARGTLRVARGLLRKNSASAVANTAPAAVPAAAKPTPQPTQAPTIPAPIIAAAQARSVASGAPVVAKAPLAQPTIPVRPLPPPATLAPQPSATAVPFGKLETEAEFQPAPDAASAGLLESLNQKITDPGFGTAGVAGPSEIVSFSEISNAVPPRAVLPPAQKFAGRSSPEIGGTFGAAVAPAKELSEPAPLAASLPSVTPFESPAPVRAENTFTPSESSAGEEPILTAKPATQSSKTPLIAVAVLLLVGAAAYFGWSQFKGHPAAPVALPQATQSTNFPPTFDDSTAAPTQTAAAPAPVDAHPASTQAAAPSETANRFAHPAQTVAPDRVSAPAPAKPVRAPLQVKTQLQRVNTASASQDATPEPPSIAGLSGASSAQALGAIAMPTNKAPAVSLGTQRVSQGVSDGLLVKKVQPIYPAQALQMHVEGTVLLQATIAKDGSIRNVKAISGSPILVRAASDAVRQWKYRPYELNGQPVEIDTQISITFKSPK